MSLTPAKNRLHLKEPVQRVESVERTVSLVGPETILTTVRHMGINKVRLWNDPMDRFFVIPDSEIHKQLCTTKEITVTVEKLRGRWTITKIGE